MESNSSILIKIILICILIVKLSQAQMGNFLDVDMYRKAMADSNKPVTGNIIIRYPEKKQNLRMQPHFPARMPFMCANFTRESKGRSSSTPTSVHELRPGDIDVIAAMGDSLIAGNGAMEEWALGTMIEYRGISWCVGGQGIWREYLTLPNILKEFNPNLVGYSTGTGEFLSKNAQLNVAFPVSADADALRQAKILVKRMRQDDRINIAHDWKMITIFFGANDLCSAQCFDKEASSPRQHARKLMLALDYLQEKLPRTFVNLIPVLDPAVSVRVKRSWMCHLLHRLFCTCFHQGNNVDEMSIIVNLTLEYQAAEEMLVNSGRYNSKNDFTVVLQPFMKLFNTPDELEERRKEVIDISFITHDCFHFSQKGHALAANLLWNNLLEPLGFKSMRKMEHILDVFKCPTRENPYLFTWKNSQRFILSGSQI